MKKTAVLVFDGLADWTVGLTTYELKTRAEQEILTVGFTDQAVVTGGGFRVLPEIVLAELDLEKIDMMILPGGAMWEKYSSPLLAAKLSEIIEMDIPVAAICGATVFLARNGFLKNVLHTSNSKEYLLDEAPGYQGQEHYRNHPAISSGGIITASGVAPEDFTYLILRELVVYSEKELVEYCQFWHCRLEPV